MCGLSMMEQPGKARDSGRFIIMRVSEICVKRIRVNQGLGVL